MGKTMGKLNDNHHAFPDLRTKFFHKQCVIPSCLFQVVNGLFSTCIKGKTSCRRFGNRLVTTCLQVWPFTTFNTKGLTKLGLINSILTSFLFCFSLSGFWFFKNNNKKHLSSYSSILTSNCKTIDLRGVCLYSLRCRGFCR